MRRNSMLQGPVEGPGMDTEAHLRLEKRAEVRAIHNVMRHAGWPHSKSGIPARPACAAAASAGRPGQPGMVDLLHALGSIDDVLDSPSWRRPPVVARLKNPVIQSIFISTPGAGMTGNASRAPMSTVPPAGMMRGLPTRSTPAVIHAWFKPVSRHGEAPRSV